MVYENIRIIAQCVVCPSIIVSWRGLAELLILVGGNAKAWAWDKRRSTDSHVFFIVLPIWGAYRPNSLLIMKENKKEEVQSRREFFKSAAKKALPILGVIALANLPLDITASKVEMGCNGCHGTCMASCKGSCYGECKGTCKYECNSGCKSSCRGTCKNTCRNSCAGSSSY